MADATRDTPGTGDISEMAIALALTRTGRRVLRPRGTASRYDLLIDEGNGSFVRVQCKTGVMRSGSIVFRIYSVTGRRARTRTYAGEVDAFGVYRPSTGKAYLVPVSAISTHVEMVSLRIPAARNGQRRRINVAETFEIRQLCDGRL